MNSQRRRHKLTRNTALTARKLTNRLGKGWRGLLLGLVLILCFSLSWGAHVYFSVQGAVNKTYHATTGHPTAKVAQKKPISVLILGVDQGIEGRHDRGNSDTMILATANPQTKSATLTSLPRDLLVDVKGDKHDKYYMGRINSAYEFCGSKGSILTTQALLNVPVHYYMEVNMKALSELVDAVGGVDVQVPFSFTYNTRFHKGKMHLNGKQALDYARMRKSDPKGDYGRQARQRQIILAIVNEALSIKSLNNYRAILKAFSQNVKTNMSFDDMMGLATNYRSCASNISSDYIHGHDAWIGGAAMQVAQTKELQRISDRVRAGLGLTKETLHNQETRQNRLNRKHHLKWSDPTAFENYVVYSRHSHRPWYGN
ncbi:MAG: LCP family protein [Lactobacillus sp.]|jgi:LCP family protein required for cell wall assembly|nr:LCP family protein [Lactobacillus sp.]MCH4068422.1 LCP family protein [Lactobacillus sp.]MCI1304562.1 LCP family protein [Lactobacillus sp.]MCI1330421.1 LCP family protein [Lactobacillus sp.]MCI1400360.1 LCP family protein [Lactobacillus sp.]